LLEVSEIAVLKKQLNSVVIAPPSKAITLRALFIAALAKGKSIIKKPLIAEDQKHAINALKQLGVKVNVLPNSIEVIGVDGKPTLPSQKIFLGNSGVSMRFLASIVALCPEGKIVLDGDARMKERPIQDLLDALKPLGISSNSLNNNGCPPVEIECGKFSGGRTWIKGELSSQFFSSLLISGVYCQKGIELHCIGSMSSKPYIDLTIDCMKSFGVKAENEKYSLLTVQPGQKFEGKTYAIEGDYSSASYFFAAAAINGGKVVVRNLNPKSLQGDKRFLNTLTKMGCKVRFGKDFVELKGPKDLKAINVDMNEMPDLVPTLAVIAAFAKGKTIIHNIAHLVAKESNRIEAPAIELQKMGIKAIAEKDSLIVFGGKPHGAEIETYNDHRMAMSFAIAGLKVEGIKIKNPDCVNKSFPEFWKELEKLKK